MLEFYFGDRRVGTLSLEGATGVGLPYFENGVEAIDDTGRHTPADGDTFLDAVERAVNGAPDAQSPYFHVGRDA